MSPWPWTIEPAGITELHPSRDIRDFRGRLIAEAGEDGDAHIMAMGPELLHALKKLHDYASQLELLVYAPGEGREIHEAMWVATRTIEKAEHEPR